MMVQVHARHGAMKKGDEKTEICETDGIEDKILEENRLEAFNEAKEALPTGFHIAQSLPADERRGVESTSQNEFVGEEKSPSVSELSTGLEQSVAKTMETSSAFGEEGSLEGSLEGRAVGEAESVSEYSVSGRVQEPDRVHSFAENGAAELAVGKYGELRAFPEVENVEMRAFPEVDETREKALLAEKREERFSFGGQNYVQGSSDGSQNDTPDEAPNHVGVGKEFLDSSLKTEVESLVQEGKEAVSPEEFGKSVVEGSVGNFPVSPGEPETAPIAGHYGVRKPVMIPDVPLEQEGVDDVLVIEDVSELDPAEVLPVRPAD